MYCLVRGAVKWKKKKKGERTVRNKKNALKATTITCARV